MKTRNSTKILAAIFAVALLVGACFALSVSADDTPTVSIAGKNVDFQDKYTIAFAVEASDDNVEVELLYYLEDPALNSKATAYQAVKGATANYANVFYTHGVSAQNITDEIWAKAHIVDTDVYSDVVKYSVAEYVYSRLYKHDIINATEESDLVEKAFLESFVEFASNAQAHLEKEEAGTLAKNYYYAYVQDGTLNGGDNSELFDPSVSALATLAYIGTAPEGKKFDNWTVITYTAEGTSTTTAENGDTVTLTGHTVITPNYESEADVSTLNAGEAFDDGRIVNATSGYVTNSSGTNTKVRYYKSNTGTAGLQTGDAIEIVADPDASKSGNKVLKFTDGSTSSYTSVHINASPDYYEGSSDNTNNKGIKTTFETLLYIEEYPDRSFTDSQTVAQPMFTYGGRSAALQFNITYSEENGEFYIATSTSGATMTTLFTGSNYFSSNEWVAIRFEWYQYDLRAEEEAIIKLYINNVHVADITPPDAMLTANGTSGEALYATKDVDHMMWKGVSDSMAVMYFDNISMYDAYIDQTIVETPAE